MTATLPAPASGDQYAYVHDQITPSDTWLIVHGQGGKPNITTVDTDSPPRVIEGDVEYIDNNTIRVTFSVAITGQAYIS